MMNYIVCDEKKKSESRVGRHLSEFANLWREATSPNTFSTGPASTSSPSSPLGLSSCMTTSSGSSPASLYALSLTSLNRPGRSSSCRYRRHIPGNRLKMFPLHHGRG